MGEKQSFAECLDESNYFGVLTYCWKQLKVHGILHMISSVVCNMLLTLWAWTTVYDMKHNDALGTTVVTTLIFTYFFLLALDKLNFRRLILFLLHIACAAILFAVSGSFFHDVLVKFIPDHGNKELFFLGFGTTVFGCIGLGAFFVDFLPTFVHQFYVIVHCSFISLIFLRILPGYTAWIVLGSLVFWDLFANLTLYDPLRIVQDKAADYRADVFRFLFSIFTSQNDEESDDDMDSECSLASKQTDGLVTVSSASDSSTSDQSFVSIDSARFGMIDLVFYGVFAGAAASNGSVMGTFAAVFGVVYGLIFTFMIPFNTKYPLRALPISVCVGAVYHFTTIYIEYYLYKSIMI